MLITTRVKGLKDTLVTFLAFKAEFLVGFLSVGVITGYFQYSYTVVNCEIH